MPVEVTPTKVPPSKWAPWVWKGPVAGFAVQKLHAKDFSTVRGPMLAVFGRHPWADESVC
jgi:hypothetical protein